MHTIIKLNKPQLSVQVNEYIDSQTICIYSTANCQKCTSVDTTAAQTEKTELQKLLYT